MYIRDGKFIELIHSWDEKIWAEIEVNGNVIRVVKEDEEQIEIYRKEKQDFLESLEGDVAPPILAEWLKAVRLIGITKYSERDYYMGIRIEGFTHFWPSFYSGVALLHCAYKHGLITRNGWQWMIW